MGAKSMSIMIFLAIFLIVCIQLLTRSSDFVIAFIPSPSPSTLSSPITTIVKNETNTEESSQTSMLTYENSDPSFPFSIQHPAEWHQHKNDTTWILFQPDFKTIDGLYVSVDIMGCHGRGKNLQEIIQDMLDNEEHTGLKDLGKSTINGNPSQTIVFDTASGSKEMETVIMGGGKQCYDVSDTADPTIYDKYLSWAQKMINSFKVPLGSLEPLGFTNKIENNSIDSSFLTYKNRDMGFKIKYPNDWKVAEHGKRVNFKSADSKLFASIGFSPGYGRTPNDIDEELRNQNKIKELISDIAGTYQTILS